MSAAAVVKQRIVISGSGLAGALEAVYLAKQVSEKENKNKNEN
jgi:hypothetical protein